MDELTNIRNTLKSERGLSNIILFLRDKQAESSQFHTEFASYLHLN